MAQLHKVEGQVEIKSNANKFFEIWARKTNLISEWCRDKYPKIELNEGTYWHSLGAIITWHFFALGRHDYVKTIVAEIDDDNKIVSYDYTEGHGQLRSNYKSLKSKIQAIPKGEGCIVKWSFEYEKKCENVPDARIYIDFLLDCAKNIDARLCGST
ncbi:hypothetical protein RND81_03G150700 [Saponaria officinalis]|uniref:Bet v I/Major latex protein domain-containing protein n=1 Tax=Saponaria officinalis TaxID=3572 RepID=A0AAW1M0F6_SAPOF